MIRLAASARDRGESMKHGMQLKVAELAGITPAFLSQILKGKRRPLWDRAKDMGKRIDVDPIVLVDGDLPEIEKALDEVAEKIDNEDNESE